jgi:hypothetical protein
MREEEEGPWMSGKGGCITQRRGGGGGLRFRAGQLFGGGKCIIMPCLLSREGSALKVNFLK